MTTCFLFNGDADGLCAQQQMRLRGGVTPDHLVTGVKRDQALMARLPGDAERAHVFDIAVEKNLAALEAALARGVEVSWYDHHRPGPLPAHPSFQGHIDTAGLVNTSLIVHRRLDPPDAGWAVMGLYGDNMDDAAAELALAHGLEAAATARLKTAGRLINYNAYGRDLSDLHRHPAELASLMAGHEDPLAWLDASGIIAELGQARADDLARADAAQRPAPGVVLLPEAAWARRVVGELANRLARREPESAHAVLVADGSALVVSVRAPLAGGASAAELCSRFPTGGGRQLAAGINRLPQEELARFLAAFASHFA